MKTREEYEIAPVFSDEYSGERFKYGFRNRPYDFSTCPKGSILLTWNFNDKENGSRHGTIEYPFQLTKEEVSNYELVDFTAIKKNNEAYSEIVINLIDELDKRNFKLIENDICRLEFDDGKVIDFIIYKNGIIFPEQSYNVGIRTNSEKEFSIIEAPTINDLKDTIQRSLKYIDKEIEKDKSQYKHEGTYLPLTQILNHAYTIRDTFNTNIENDSKPLEQANKIIDLVNNNNLRDTYLSPIKLSAEAAFGGNPLRHNETDRQAVIRQLENYIQNNVTTESNQPAQSGKTHGGTIMEATTDTVQVKTETTISGAKLSNKLEYNAKSFAKKVNHFETQLERITNMPEKIDKINKESGEVREIPRSQELNSIARREAINNMSKGEYVHNMIVMKEMNKKKETGELTNEEEAKYSKAKQRNATIEKSAKHPANAEKLEKEFKKAFYLNCTPKGLSEQLGTNKTNLENANSLIEKLKAFPDHEFKIKNTEQRKLSDLKYDLNFGRQLDAALAAKNTPAPEAKPAGRKR